MGRYVEIRKQSQALHEHYYEVTPHDHSDIQPFYIGLDEATKKVFFYEDVEAEPVATVDLDGNIQCHNEAAQDRIPRWLIFLSLKKAKDAFLTDKFP